MIIQQTRRIAAIAMGGAAGLAIAGFTALGSIFDYPAILKEPTEEILAAYAANQSAVTGWFLALMISAALLAPVGLLLGRIAGGTMGRWIAGIGIAAATVQVIGLSRWVLLIPGVSADAQVPATAADAHYTFEQLHFHRLRPHRHLHRAGRHRDGTVDRAALGGPARLPVGGPHRDRRGHPVGGQHREPEQLRRLHRLVPVADRDGRRAVAFPGGRSHGPRPRVPARLTARPSEPGQRPTSTISRFSSGSSKPRRQVASGQRYSTTLSFGRYRAVYKVPNDRENSSL
jgi:hypothetical protein